jgi:fermentation-respiration switch protein FrsA (DUF1100 family)
LTWAAAFYVINPPSVKITSTPADYDVAYEDVTVTTADGLNLVGWYLPGTNGATIIAQHGYRGNRESLLFEAIAINEKGYSVLLTTSRAHDVSEGQKVTFGAYEMRDLEAWYQYLLTRPDVDPEMIGILGESMGGGMAIQYAAKNENIKTVVTASAFAFTNETVETFIFQDVARPGALAPLVAQFMVHWAEQNGDFKTSEIDTEKIIAQISPRPILLVHGGKDSTVSPKNGHELHQAAQGQAQLIYFPEADHCNFDEVAPVEYVQGLVSFFDQNLLAG